MTENQPAQGSADETILIWVTEGTWGACVDAARRVIPADARAVLPHVTPEEISATAHAAYAGLLGRGHPERDPGQRVAACDRPGQRRPPRSAAALISRLA